MKQQIGFWVVGLVFAGQCGWAEMHEFKLPDGRALKAEVLDYNARLDKVELKLESGKRVKIKPSVFVEPDQKYIQEWASMDGFRNNSFFKVECDKKEIENWKEEDEIFETKFERYVYEVTLDNRNDMPIENLKVEYCIFYEQEENDSKHEKITTQNIQPGTLDVERLWAKEKRTLKTDSVVLKEFEFNSSDFYYENGDPESTSGDIKGIWVRMSVQTPEGLTATRNIYEPASIEGKYTWQAPPSTSYDAPSARGGKKKGKRKKRA